MNRIFILVVFGFVLLAGCCGPIDDGGGKIAGDTGPDIKASCEKFDIITPSYEFYKSMNDIPSFSCDVTNEGSETVTVLVSSELEGYSNEFEQTLVLSPGATKTVGIHFSHKEDFYEIQEAKSATLKTRFSVGGETLRVDTENVQVEKSTVFSPELGDEDLIAMWVTYNDPCIEEVISEAKKFTSTGEFVGYMGNDDTLYDELSAVFYSLYFQDMDYVSSTLSTTNVETSIYQQNVRLPHQSLKYKQMNCIDGAVLYAAILEKLDYETGIAFVPGHSFVVVGHPEGYWIPIETTVTGDDISSFEDAVTIGLENMEDPELYIIDVHGAFQSGITPMPVGAHECELKDLDEEAALYREFLESASTGDCYDGDYGQIADGYCTLDNAAYCDAGTVFWDLTEEVCGGVYPDCMDSDYAYIPDGYCTWDNAAYCDTGIVFWDTTGEVCG